ncbi:MAG: HDOD domain-containing protein [Deltaproteobacteria bacterium]|nr:HDOD domain-containing protein [Deltaproteobacteria bacterium]
MYSSSVIVFRKLEMVHNLPTLPQIIQQLSRLINDPNSDASQIKKLLENDPSLMTNILSVANSVFYRGVSKPITSLKLAIARLGLSCVYNLGLSSAIFSVFNDGEISFDRKEFWKHSISSGIAMNVLFPYSNLKERKEYSLDVLHLMGVIHDMGRIVFDQFFHEDFIEALKISIEKNCPLFMAEEEVFKTTHAEVGAWLASHWSLSEIFVESIRNHHHPFREEGKYNDLSALVNVADYLCNIQHWGDSGGPPCDEDFLASWYSAGLPAEKYDELLLQIQAALQESTPLFLAIR